MHPILAKSFGGLSASYYFRNFLFGLLFPLVILGFLNAGSNSFSPPGVMLFMFALNTLLYPYSRFVYERVIGFIIGDNVFLVNGVFILLAKFMTMALCWSAALCVAPAGLLYLYLHHSRDQG